jgi:hypothetical protein
MDGVFLGLHLYLLLGFFLGLHLYLLHVFWYFFHSNTGLECV